LAEGLKVALAELRESRGWGVVMVAGMEYASWVESKGFTVLREAKNDLNVYLDEAFKKFGIIE